MNSQEIKNRVANILGVEMSASWDIVDSIPESNLYLVHYAENADMSKYGSLKGVVVDLKGQTIVCRSFGYMPSAIADGVPLNIEGNYSFIDEFGNPHSVNPAQGVFKMGFEGVMIRVFKHNGKVYRCSHRRLNLDKSRWGNSLTFLQMYEDLNGPSDETLFNPNSKYSPYTHIFLMAHPDVLVCTKQDVGPGYMVYLGPKEMWSTNPEECPYKQLNEDLTKPDGFENDPRPDAGWIDETLRIPESKNLLPAIIKKPLLFTPFNLNVNQVNKHLRFGFMSEYNDSQVDLRLRTGEFAILYKLAPNGMIEGLLRIQSTPYAWRSEMKGNQSNLLHRFYELSDQASIKAEIPEGYKIFTKKFPLMTPYPTNQVLMMIQKPLILWPQSSLPVDVLTRDQRLKNIWICFLMSVPIHSQFYVLTFYDLFFQSKGQIIRWIRMIDESYPSNSDTVSDHVKLIIDQARSNAKERQANGNNKDKSGNLMSVNQMTKNNIKTLVDFKRSGKTLYRLDKEMKEYYEKSEV